MNVAAQLQIFTSFRCHGGHPSVAYSSVKNIAFRVDEISPGATNVTRKQRFS